MTIMSRFQMVTEGEWKLAFRVWRETVMKMTATRWGEGGHTVNTYHSYSSKSLLYIRTIYIVDDIHRTADTIPNFAPKKKKKNQSRSSFLYDGPRALQLPPRHTHVDGRRRKHPKKTPTCTYSNQYDCECIFTPDHEPYKERKGKEIENVYKEGLKKDPYHFG